ncbi:hypothetical protein ACFFJY_07950 [Fictibacillus aquaticus]|uniref:Uncharacterized protein n=1 Tax=Fictibacillus aquaticus TaxID=2021314 RepID=A0A235F9E3_9BACL|nr:hypothetical protein [Fictibacillus aquaticus]OYD57888.1 hypothetical protein CGZ90_08280 [Fictibacillus aquaticus]
MMTVKEVYAAAVKDKQPLLITAIEYLVKDRRAITFQDTSEKLKQLLDAQKNEEMIMHTRFTSYRRNVNMQQQIALAIDKAAGNVTLQSLKQQFPSATKEQLSRAIYNWLADQEIKQ